MAIRSCDGVSLQIEDTKLLPKPYGAFPRINFNDAAAASKVYAGTGCYRIICMPAGKSYVGSSIDLVKRFIQHRQDLQLGRHPNSKLQWAWNKCGPAAFVFQVLELYRGKWSKDCLAPMEQRWIDLHTRRYNIRPAGSDEWIKARQDEMPALKTRVLAARLRPSPGTTQRVLPNQGTARPGPAKRQPGGTISPSSGPQRNSGGDTRHPGRRQGRKK